MAKSKNFGWAVAIVALLIGAVLGATLFPVEKEITKEVPVEKVVTKEVVKEVPADFDSLKDNAVDLCMAEIKDNHKRGFNRNEISLSDVSDEWTIVWDEKDYKLSLELEVKYKDENDKEYRDYNCEVDYTAIDEDYDVVIS